MNSSKKQQKECVWDYPRPPKVEHFLGEIRVEFNGKVIAKTNRALRVLETSNPPVYFIHQDQVELNYLFKRVRTASCCYKGTMKFFDIAFGDKRSDYAAWYIPKPTPEYDHLKDYIAFFAHKVDACFINNERVIPQPGEFYGGWITSNIVGPYKGLPGTDSW